MRPFSDYLSVILKHEGGLVNNPNDPGGITNYGISLMFLKGISLPMADIDHDGDVDADDIRKMTTSSASNLYKAYFWDKTNIESVNNELLRLQLFDMGVNAGNKTAIKLLQILLQTVSDGIIGPATLSRIKSYSGDIVFDYAKTRKNYYTNLTVQKQNLKEFLKGWINRVNTTNFL
jgi:lysozyme family protein